jgi:hypothetical protein
MRKRFLKTVCMLAVISIASVGVSCDKEAESGDDYYAKGLQMGKDFCSCMKAALDDAIASDYYEGPAECLTRYTSIPPSGASPQQMADFGRGFVDGSEQCQNLGDGYW